MSLYEYKLQECLDSTCSHESAHYPSPCSLGAPGKPLISQTLISAINFAFSIHLKILCLAGKNLHYDQSKGLCVSHLLVKDKSVHFNLFLKFPLEGGAAPFDGGQEIAQNSHPSVSPEILDVLGHDHRWFRPSFALLFFHIFYLGSMTQSKWISQDSWRKGTNQFLWRPPCPLFFLNCIKPCGLNVFPKICMLKLNWHCGSTKKWSPRRWLSCWSLCN